MLTPPCRGVRCPSGKPTTQDVRLTPAFLEAPGARLGPLRGPRLARLGKMAQWAWEWPWRATEGKGWEGGNWERPPDSAGTQRLHASGGPPPSSPHLTNCPLSAIVTKWPSSSLDSERRWAGSRQRNRSLRHPHRRLHATTHSVGPARAPSPTAAPLPAIGCRGVRAAVGGRSRLPLAGAIPFPCGKMNVVDMAGSYPAYDGFNSRSRVHPFVPV